MPHTGRKRATRSRTPKVVKRQRKKAARAGLEQTYRGPKGTATFSSHTGLVSTITKAGSPSRKAERKVKQIAPGTTKFNTGLAIKAREAMVKLKAKRRAQKTRKSK